MSIILVQTDTTGTDGVIQACSAIGSDVTQIALQATQLGTPGVASQQISNGASAAESLYVSWESAVNEPNQLSWPAGNWVINLNITAATKNFTWTRTYVCRLNSAGVSQATVASLTGQSIAIGAQVPPPTQVKMTLTNGTQQTAAAGDKIWVGLVFSSVAQSGTLTYKSNLTIVTPLSGGPPPRGVQVRGSGLLVAGTPVQIGR